MTAAVAAGFVLGLAGSAHCAAMCGPLAIAMRGRRAAGGPDGLAGPTRFALYHGARLTAYGAAGLVAGTAGRALSLLGLGRVLAAVAGLVLILAAAHALGLVRASAANAALTRRLVRVSSSLGRISRERPVLGAIGAGVLNASLPCGMVYGALTTAAALGGSAEATLFMVLFGLGTVPAIAACWAMADAVGPLLRRRLRFALPVTLAAVGVLLIARGLAGPRGDDGDRHATHPAHTMAHDATPARPR